MPRPDTPPILITGAARSGTSLTAGIVHLHGPFGGVMSGPTSHNRKGMFENARIRNDLIKPLLRKWNCDSLGQDPLPSRECRERAPSDTGGLREGVLSILDQEGYQGGPWFYKGAKMCLMWPLWAEAFPDARWIIVRRDRDQIVRSCMRTGFMRKRSTPESWAEWVREHEVRFQDMADAGLKIREVYPSEFLNGELRSIKEVIEKFLGLGWREEAVREFIDPSLWHK